MLRNHKTEEHKKLRRLWNEYVKLQKSRKTSGEWIDVEPYQRGWVRSFVLRDDAKNRTDAREMQQVLDKINNTVYCNNEKFLHRNWKTGKMEPIPQRPKYLNDAEYNALTEKQKSFFEQRTWIANKVTVAGRGNSAEKKYVTGYVFRNDFYLVFKIEPNIVTEHWIPNQEIESRYGELSSHFEKNGLWGKFNKAMHWSTGYEWDKNSHKYRNKYGFEFEDVAQ